MNLLIIDDEIEICEMLVHEFEDFGYNVDYFTSAREAVAFSKSRTYDLIICDLKLPDMSLYEVMESIPRPNYNKFIILTGDNSKKRSDFIGRKIDAIFYKTDGVVNFANQVKKLLE